MVGSSFSRRSCRLISSASRGGDVSYRLIVPIAKRKAARRLLSVASVDPKLGIIAAPSNMEPWDSPIAGIAGGNKLGAMIHCTRGSVSTGAGGDFAALQHRLHPTLVQTVFTHVA
jgi:hypothetical protein